MVGETSRSIEYQRPAALALRDVTQAFSSIGLLLTSSDRTMTVTGSTRYRLQRVKLRVSIAQRDANSSIISVHGSSSEVWSAGSRDGADRLIEALAS